MTRGIEADLLAETVRVCLLAVDSDPRTGRVAYRAVLFEGGRKVDEQSGRDSILVPATTFYPRARKILAKALVPPHLLAVYGRGWSEFIRAAVPEQFRGQARVLDLRQAALAFEPALPRRAGLADIAQAFRLPSRTEDLSPSSPLLEDLLWAVIRRADERGLSLPELLERKRASAAPVDFQRYAFTEETIRSLPAAPGVYWMRNREGRVIYVGKARRLDQRLADYFRDSSDIPPKLQAIRGQLSDLEYLPVGSELEALLQENRRIADYQPDLNVQRRVEEGTSRYDFPTFPIVVVAPSSQDKRVELFFFGEDQFHAAQLRVDPLRPPRKLLGELMAQFLDAPSRRLPRRRGLIDWGREGNEICCRHFARAKDRLQWMVVDRSRGLEALVAALVAIVRLVAERPLDPGEFRMGS